MDKSKKILIIKGQSQYDVLRIATDYVAQEFMNRGYKVKFLDLTNEENYQINCNDIFDNSYEMIYSFNALMLDLKNGNDIHIINYSQLPYVTYLVDHPIYQYERLACAYKNLSVATFDGYNVEFLKQYYPYLKKSEFIPFFGFKALDIVPYMERTIDILFVGSYCDPEKSKKELESFEGVFKTIAENVVQILLYHTDYTLEQAIRSYLNRISFEISDEEFLDLISIMKPVDKYIRNYFRDKVVRTIMDAGLTLTVYGNGWDSLKSKYGDKLNLLSDGNTSLLDGIEIMAKSRIVLSVMPWFKDAIQDRIITTMLNGSVCVTDTSKYMVENLVDNNNIIFYNLGEIEKLPSKIMYLIDNPVTSANIAKNGEKVVSERYTIKHFVDKIIDFTPKNYRLHAREDFLQKYSNTKDHEIIEILEHIKVNSIGVYNYPFTLDYYSLSVEVNYDEQVDMYYVNHHSKRMYYPKKYRSKEVIAQNYRFISLEQDMKSPHRYLDDIAMVQAGDVIIDAGVAEGNFALDVVDKAAKLYLIECNQDWIQALEQSFKPYMDKVVIVNKYLSNIDDDNNITIDNLVNEKVNFIKMDIEGAEIDALSCAGKTLLESDRITCTICSYHKNGDEEKITNILKQNNFNVSTSAGYMFFLHDDYALENLELRRGIVRGVKDIVKA